MQDWLRAARFGFVCATILYCGSIAFLLQRCGETELSVIAARHDRRASFILAAGLVIVAASFALIFALLATRTLGASGTALAAASIFSAWALLNMLFAIHYAHIYFTTPDPPLDFPGGGTRAFSDFLYFSFVVGMTFQVSDVSILDRSARRLALAHSILAFLFSVFVVALAVNALGSVI